MRPVLACAVLLALPAGGIAGDEHEGEPRPFPEVRNSQPGGAEPNTPRQAAAAFRVPDGFEVTLFAGEPDVAQPIGMTFDDRGRLWVAECFTYAGRGFDADHGDRVVIFEDTDGDGRHDERTVFWDRGWMLTGLCYGFGGLWVLNDGTLSFLPDADRDDVPDGPPVALLDGFTREAGHNVVNGLCWGPDGWLYGRHGITATSHVGAPGAPDDKRTPLNCGIWRFHPTRHAFEVVARGTTNPWGLDWNEYGDGFFTNNVIGHAWHLIPGAHYRRMFGTDFNPHLYGLIDQHADHYHWDADGGDWTASRAGSDGASDLADDFGGGHSHSGGMIYQGDNWPAEYRGDLYMCNTHGRRINRDRPVPHGSGYKIVHEPDFAFAGSPWFKGVELKSGPDGGVFLLDWTDLGECHDHDGVHRTSGRVYKITYGKPERAGEKVDLAGLPAAELIETAVSHPNVWHRRHATRLAIEGAANGEGALLDHARDPNARAIVYSEKESLRYVRLFIASSAVDPFASDPVAGYAASLFLEMLEKAPASHARAASSGLVGEAAASSPGIDATRSEWLKRTLRESDARSRLAVASQLQGLPVTQRFPIAALLASHPEDADDHNLPLMIWYGVEPAVAAFPDQAVGFAENSNIPLLREYTARRLASELPSEPHARAAGALLSVAANGDADFQTDVLAGTLAALDGRRKVAPPPKWEEVQPAFLASDDEQVRSLARRLAVIFGDGAALDELRAVVADGTKSDEARAAAIGSLAEARDEAVLAVLLDLLKRRRLGDRGVLAAAARATAAFESDEAAAVLIGGLPGFRNQAKDAALAALVSRRSYAKALAEALPGLGVTESGLSAEHVRALRAFHDPGIDAVLDEHWGTTRATPAEKLAEIAAWKAKLTDEALAKADPAAGRVVYNQVCGRCHTLYGEGGDVGPNLTGSDRHDLDYVLGNVIDPSATVPAAWRVSTVLLADGRALVGVLSRPTEATVTVRTADAAVTVPAADVLEVAPGTASLMPEGLFRTLTDGQVRDLVRYLRTDRR